jgi:cytochrome c-type biogenesis protein CcmH
MLIWITFAAMTGAAVFALLWPLGRGRTLAFTDAADAASLYRDQIAEIDRDLGRRLIGPQEADAARAEAGRRLLRAAGDEADPAAETESSLRRRRASSALALSCVPLLALIVYGAYGSPAQPDLPLAARLKGSPEQQDFSIALARIESHLAANPTDARGWAVIAPVYLRQGRAEDAARAFGNAVRLGEPDAELLAGQGEALVLAAGGVVTAAARETLSKAVARDPKNARARYFLAIGKEQDGDTAGAAQALRALVADAPGEAGWLAMVRDRLALLEGDASRGAIAALPALPAQDQQAAIRGMVGGLAARLAQGGGSLDEWVRLIRSQTVLGNREEAKAALATARQRLADDPTTPPQLDALAAELGLKAATP